MSYIILGVSEILIFWGYEDFKDILGGHDKIGLVLGVSSMYLRVFFKVNVQNENIFAWQKFQIFFGVLDIPDIHCILAANGRCWAQSYV